MKTSRIMVMRFAARKRVFARIIGRGDVGDGTLRQGDWA
jgi:hypothetical protein